MKERVSDGAREVQWVMSCQNDWHDVGRPLSCNVFAIARFLVVVFQQKNCHVTKNNSALFKTE